MDEEFENYYEILNIPNFCSDEKEIKKAYRKLAHIYHPDKVGGNENKFKKINKAYQILINPKEKALFDFKLYLFLKANTKKDDEFQYNYINQNFNSKDNVFNNKIINFIKNFLKKIFAAVLAFIYTFLLIFIPIGIIFGIIFFFFEKVFNIRIDDYNIPPSLRVIFMAIFFTIFINIFQEKKESILKKLHKMKIEKDDIFTIIIVVIAILILFFSINF